MILRVKELQGWVRSQPSEIHRIVVWNRDIFGNIFKRKKRLLQRIEKISEKDGGESKSEATSNL